MNIGADGRSDVTVTEPMDMVTQLMLTVIAPLLTANITNSSKPKCSIHQTDVSALASASNILITDRFSANTNTEIDLSNVSYN